MSVKTIHILLFFSALLATNLVFGQADVSVRVEVENPTPAKDEEVYATIYITNEGEAYRNNLQVSLRLSQSLFFIKTTTPNIIFDESAQLWAVDQLKNGETDSLEVVLMPNYGGVHTITAELTAADMVDWDSFPGNDRQAEDDQDQACVSVPVQVECGQSLVLSAPRNQSSYTWYRNDELLEYAVNDTIHPIQSGEYRYEIGGNSCASGNCCPVIVDRSMCRHDLALVATSSDVSQSSNYQTITLTLFNQGAGAVSKVSLYVTTSSFMRLKPGTTGWQLAGSRMTKDWTGLLQPGDSTEVTFEIQAITGGQGGDYQMFSEISAFYSGTTVLDDADSTPDFDPTNDKVVNDAYLLAANEDEDDSDVVGLTNCPLTTVSGNQQVCLGETLELIANANVSNASYAWSGSDQLSCTSCASPTITVTGDIDLTLVTTTSEGCLQTQVIEVRTKNCIQDLLLIAGLNDPDQTCFAVAPGAELQFCEPSQIPSAMTLQDSYKNGEACVTATTDGTWGGGFEACLEVCDNGDCRPIELKVIGKPRLDEITAQSGQPICISSLLQMDQSPMDVRVDEGTIPLNGGASSIELIATGNNCFEFAEPSTSYETTEFNIIHTYQIFGETIYDTTLVIIPGKTICDFEIFANESHTIEADPVTQETSADQVLCLEGSLGELLAASYTVDGEEVDVPSVGCDAFSLAKYSLRGLPRRWNDNGWRIISYTKGTRPAFTNFYAATMNDVVAKLKSVDPSSTVTFTSSQLLLEIKGFTENPGALILLHVESNTRLTMQPLMVTGYDSWALQIPEGLGIGEYEIVATNNDGCVDVSTLVVVEGVQTTTISDTIYASIEIGEPFAVCGLEGHTSPSNDWNNLTQDCYVITPANIGFGGYHAFAKTENGITTETVYALDVVERTCAPMMVSDHVEVTSVRCRSEYVPLGLTRPDYRVTSSSGRVLSASQVTGSRAGAKYDFSSLESQGLVSSYEVISWAGVANAAGLTGNLQSILRQLRESGADVDAYWDSSTITAAGSRIGDLKLKNTSTGQQKNLSPIADKLDTYGRFYGRTGKNSVVMSLASCSDQMIAEVACQVVVWSGGFGWLNGEPGSGTILGLSQIEMPNSVATWEIWENPEFLSAVRLPDSSGISFTVTSDKFVQDSIVLLVRDTAGVSYHVAVELKPEEGGCLTEIWQELELIVVADPRTEKAVFFLPKNFDRDNSELFINGSQKKGGFVKRDQVVGQTYTLDGSFSKIVTPSGKTVEVTGSLEDALAQVLAKADASTENGSISFVNLEAETILYGLDQNGIWQPMEPLKQKVEQRYAVMLEAGDYEFEITTNTLGQECSDRIKVNVKSSTFDFIEEEVFVKIGQTQEWCLPKVKQGNQLLKVDNVCIDQSGEYAAIDWDKETNCLAFEGYEAGTEFVCIKRTYLDGSIDSIELKLVIDAGAELKAVADHQDITLGQFEIIDILGNDNISDEPVEIHLISEPFFGRAQVVGNRAVEYLHDGEGCEKDVFTYEVCQGDNCDSTTVELQVICAEVLVYNGLSPNGDGLNDELTILGLERYPDHSITVFNRQGNVLAAFTEYQNDWNGEVDGEVLPSGTYFYVIDLGDGDTKSGYIQLTN